MAVALSVARDSYAMTTDILEIARLKEVAGRDEATAEDQVACAQRLLDARLPDQALPYLLRASEAVPSAQLAALAGSVFHPR